MKVIEMAGMMFYGAVLVGFVVGIIVALRSRKPAAIETCGRSISGELKITCTRGEGHSGLHSAKHDRHLYWWRKDDT